LSKRFLESFRFPFSDAGKGSKFELHSIESYQSSFLFDSRSHLVPKRSCALQRIYRDSVISLAGQISRRQVGTIPHGLSQTQNARLCVGIYLGMAVKGAMDCP